MYIECACVRAEQEVEVFFFVLYIQCMYIYTVFARSEAAATHFFTL